MHWRKRPAEGAMFSYEERAKHIWAFILEKSEFTQSVQLRRGSHSNETLLHDTRFLLRM